MFRWYKNAAIAYAYLSDVPPVRYGDMTRFVSSRYFTRGWTLQELLAPLELVFYSSAWTFLGPKRVLAPQIASSTGIDVEYLLGAGLESASIAKRMSWASRRTTSRVEDMAYCLLGIFDVSMPVVYGEGSRAFRRLQEELIRFYPEDHTIFAWGRKVSEFTGLVKGDELDGMESSLLDESVSAHDGPLLGLLARSPRDFQHSGDLSPWEDSHEFYRLPTTPTNLPSVIGGTIRIDLPVVAHDQQVWHRWHRPGLVQNRRGICVLLLCTDHAHSPVPVALLLVEGSRSQYGRTGEFALSAALYPPSTTWNDLITTTETLHVAPQPQRDVAENDILLRRHVYPLQHVSYVGRRWVSGIDWHTQDGLLKAGRGDAVNSVILLYRLRDGRVFGVALRRYMHHHSQGGGPPNELEVGIVPTVNREALRWLGATTAAADAATATAAPASLSLMRKMTGRTGEWTVAVEGLPTVRVRMERVKMEPGWYVYVLDVTMSRRETNAVMQESFNAEVTSWAAAAAKLS